MKRFWNKPFTGHAKKAAALLLSLAMLLSLAACGEEPGTSSDPGSSSSSGSSVKTVKSGDYGKRHGDSLFILNQEPILTEDEELGNSGYYTFKITNLADKELQDSINTWIKDTVNKSGYYPPYRGTGIFMEDIQKEDYAYAYKEFSANDYLSVRVINYYYAGGWDFSAADYNCLNLDLRTGKELTLADLFSPGFNYEAFINDYIRNYTAEHSYFDNESTPEYSMETISLVKPFAGINADQKFYLTDYGLELVFDYENPEFDFGKYAYGLIISIPYSEFEDAMNICRDCDISLYEGDERPVKTLVAWSGPEEYIRLNEGALEINDVLSLSAPVNAPEKLIEGLKADVMKLGRDSSGMREFYDSVNLKDPEYYYISQTRGINVQRFGNMYNAYIRCSFDYYASDGGFWSDSVYDNVSDSSVYDLKGNELKFEDLFVPGFDSEALAYKLIETALEDNINYGMIPLEGETAEDLKNIRCFDLSTDRLYVYSDYINFKTDYSACYRDFLIGSVGYDEIGYENLRQDLFGFN